MTESKIRVNKRSPITNKKTIRERKIGGETRDCYVYKYRGKIKVNIVKNKRTILSKEKLKKIKYGKSKKISQKPNLNWTKKRLVEYVNNYNAKAEKQQYWVNFPKNKIAESKPYKDLTKKQQEIIFRELKEERYLYEDDPEMIHEYYSQLNYLFTKVHPKELPPSQWERFEVENKVIDKEKILNVLEKTKNLEKTIKKEGYKQDHPLTLTYEKDKKGICIDFGNHRLQAVRNLIAKKQLDPNFQIPIIIIQYNPTLLRKIKRKNKQKSNKS